MLDKVCQVGVVLCANLTMVFTIDGLNILRTNKAAGRIRQITVEPICHGPVEELVETVKSVHFKVPIFCSVRSLFEGKLFCDWASNPSYLR